MGMWASVENYAQKAGLSLVDPGFAPQSRLAHLLTIFWPGSSSTKNPLIERIYQAYLSERKNIGDPSVLVEIAGRFGVSQEACNKVLNMMKDRSKTMDQHRAEAIRYRFPGMPAYRFQKQTSFGALSVEAWRRVLTNPKGDVMFNQMKQLYDMQKKAKELQRQLEAIKVEKTNFSKTLAVKANGAQRLENITIDSGYFNPDKKSDLEKSLVKLINDALEDAQKQSAMQAATLMKDFKGLNIPGL